MRRKLPLTASLIAIAGFGLGAGLLLPAPALADHHEEAADADSEALAALFEAYDAANLAASPEGKAYRGIRDEDYGKWGDVSDEAEEADFRRLQDAAATMEASFDLASLNAQDALSYRLFALTAERSASLHPFRKLGYIYDQRRGPHTGLPAFLINIHRISTAADAQAYVARIAGAGAQMSALTAEAAVRADAGVMPPDWVYPYMISDVEGLLAAGDDNAVLEDFAGKVAALELDAAQSDALMAAATAAWNAEVRPAYEGLLVELKRQQAMAPTEDGIWRLPQGDEYYAALLKSYTTTDLTAEEIHNIGLREVERIHGEMREIMAQVGFEGTLQEFFEYTRNGDQFFYETREEYLAQFQLD